MSKVKKIIYFDGVCNLCNSAVRFVVRHDKQAIFTFASLQSDFAQKSLAHTNGQGISRDSVVYQDGEQFYDRSDAVLKIMKDLGGVWKILSVLSIFPKKWRDLAYSYLASHRYQWFGKNDACSIPSRDMKSRFLD